MTASTCSGLKPETTEIGSRSNGFIDPTARNIGNRRQSHPYLASNAHPLGNLRKRAGNRGLRVDALST
jgi:hypothetical protein